MIDHEFFFAFANSARASLLEQQSVKRPDAKAIFALNVGLSCACTIGGRNFTGAILARRRQTQAVWRTRIKSPLTGRTRPFSPLLPLLLRNWSRCRSTRRDHPAGASRVVCRSRCRGRVGRDVMHVRHRRRRGKIARFRCFGSGFVSAHDDAGASGFSCSFRRRLRPGGISRLGGFGFRLVAEQILGIGPAR